VLSLFLAEALLIGVFGATTGLLAGIVAVFGLSAGFGSGDQPGISPVYLASDLARVWAITVGLSFMAGLFPAFKASRLLPILALQRD
jgi:putative ABC transport system permease protein